MCGDTPGGGKRCLLRASASANKRYRPLSTTSERQKPRLRRRRRRSGLLSYWGRTWVERRSYSSAGRWTSASLDCELEYSADSGPDVASSEGMKTDGNRDLDSCPAPATPCAARRERRDRGRGVGCRRDLLTPTPRLNASTSSALGTEPRSRFLGLRLVQRSRSLTR